MLFKIFLPLFFLFGSFAASAQKTGYLTGTWEGDLGNDEFLQISFIQTGDKICGYTWDYMWRNRRSYCKANFSGFYDKQKDRWYLKGTSFITNSGSHVLMEIMFQINRDNGNPVLEGFCRAMSDDTFPNLSEPETISLERTSYKPEMITKEMDDCVAANLPPKKAPAVKKPIAAKPVTAKPVPAKPAASKKPATPVTAIPKKPVVPVKPVPAKPSPAKPPVKLPVKPPVKKDSVIALPVKKKVDSIPTITPTVKPTPDKEVLPLKTAGRVNRETGRTVVKDKKITLYIYDNAVTDGDSVSIYYNNRLIMDSKRLSEKPIVVELNLDENIKVHTISMVALNLGSIPPNTALVVFTDSEGKRHELFSKATLSENALLVFEYKPD